MGLPTANLYIEPAVAALHKRAELIDRKEVLDAGA
jgi:hypothetical protein